MSSFGTLQQKCHRPNTTPTTADATPTPMVSPPTTTPSYNDCCHSHKHSNTLLSYYHNLNYPHSNNICCHNHKHSNTSLSYHNPIYLKDCPMRNQETNDSPTAQGVKEEMSAAKLFVPDTCSPVSAEMSSKKTTTTTPAPSICETRKQLTHRLYMRKKIEV